MAYLNDALKKVARDEKIHLIARVDGQFAGSCEVRRFARRKRSAGEIGISIARDFRGEGIGYVCMTELIAQASRIGLRLLYLHVFENNERAIHLYEKAGFRVSGTVPAMYEYKGGHVGETTMYLPLVS
jgi:tRNA threonylcarbamoyladenosine biosynthesis protein TsaB